MGRKDTIQAFDQFEKREEFARDYYRGYTHEELSDKYGIKRGSIGWYVKKLGLQKKKSTDVSLSHGRWVLTDRRIKVWEFDV